MDTQRGGTLKPEGFKPFDQPEWKNQSNSPDTEGKRCPRCNGLKKRNLPFCKPCSQDTGKNQQELRDLFRQLRELRGN